MELPNNPPDAGVAAAPGVDVGLVPNENEGVALPPVAVPNNPIVGAVVVVAGFEAPLEAPPTGVLLKLKVISERCRVPFRYSVVMRLGPAIAVGR